MRVPPAEPSPRPAAQIQSSKPAATQQQKKHKIEEPKGRLPDDLIFCTFKTK